MRVLIHLPCSSGKQPHSSPGSRSPFGLALLLPVGFAQHGNRIKLFLLEPGIYGRQFFLRQRPEVVDRIFQFVAEGVGARRLVIRWTSLIVVHASVELPEM